MKRSLFVSIVLLAIALNAPSQTTPYGSNAKAGSYLEANDIRIYYETYGKGQPLLLLHGNGGSIESFAAQIPVLAKHFKVIAIDSRAQGRTSDSDKEITYALMASDVAALIERLNLDSVFVVGWSDGGIIGLELALAYPQHVKKLVAIGANFSHENFMSDTARTAVMKSDDPLIMKTREAIQSYSTARKRLSPNPEHLAEAGRKLENLIANYPNLTTEQLKKINAPTLVVAGDHDIIREEHTVQLYKALPHAQLLIIPGSSHLAVWERPEFVNDEMIRFFETPYRDIDRYYFFR